MGEIGILSPVVEGMSWRAALDSVGRAEHLGYSSISEGESWGQDAFTRLSWLASATSRIRIGTSIVPVFGRSPVNLAMTALTMDWITKGRFFLGVGATGQLLVEAFHGDRFHKPLTRMREYIDVVRKASRGEQIEHDGEFFHVHHFQLRFPPERSHLPIYVGAIGPSSLRLTGELADGWLPIFFAPGRMQPQLDEIAAGAEAAGRSLADVHVSAQVSIHVTDDVRAARDRERSHLAFFIGAQGPYFREHMRRIGFSDVAERVSAAFATGDYAGAARQVSDELVDAVTVLGNPEECHSQIQRYFDAGVHEVRLLFTCDTPEEYQAAVQAMAPRARREH